MDGDCWTWTQGLHPVSGQPQATIDGKGGQLVRRWVAKQTRVVQPGRRVSDTCKNPRCCNPEHLTVMTYSQVLVRCYDEGRRNRALEYATAIRRGRGAGLIRLTREQALALRARMIAGEAPEALAGEAGITASTLRRIRSGEHWPETLPGASIFTWRPE
jgi:hypothetical protein